MPRRPRIVVPNIPLHIIQRGNNKQACFFADNDYLFYLQWLEEYALTSGCLIHAYVLMTNHVHLLLTPKSNSSTGNLLKRLGQRYVQYINRTYRRTGTLWEGRYRSCLVQEEKYLLTCQRYIELNPVRAGIVEHPGEFKWSSYRHNGQGEMSGFITPHILYQSLGETNNQQQTTYRGLFRYELEPDEIDQIRKATNGNFALGTKRFQNEISIIVGRRAFPGKAGRPRTKK
ncbi:transposase [Desulfobacter hydrogenophilus]|uniref:Transposase n=1 Tax=Desulfobacter hydrogenophilus TaxID=2291 RepID=A0A328FEI3_9BACT|nr:transposase [Desulfobacter hydrogenophilus]NDY72942.1 transposase [Desulfobacter hydrogenophilus]QBH12444.1 transposase [Desulfobacter hydrogenophilus]RAM01475.1 transposase [Desulfobacter hydrogenophilus]